MPYMVGQVYTTAIDVTDKNGQPVVPASVTLTITRMGTTDTPSTPTITPAAHMSYDYTLAAEGLYRFDWLPATPGAPQTEFVTCRGLRSVISLAEAREYLAINDTRSDNVLQSLMMSATTLAENIVGTIVPTTYTDDWLPGSSKPILKLPHAPLISASSVTLIKSIYPGGPQWQTADVIVNPQIGTVYPASYIDFWLGPWLATYQAGRLVPSENIINGTREILWDLFATQRGVFGDLAYPELADVAALEAQIPPDYHIPGRAAELLEGERLPAFG